MASLATAWVDIVPRFSDLSSEFKKSLSGVDASGAGSKIGSELGSSISNGVKSRMGAIGDTIGKVTSQAGAALAGVGKAGLAASAVAIPAIGAIGKTALDAYSTWEQAVGGVDTLFKNASQTVQKYAAQAYRTAGVSANSYMNQVTSFAASLVSSLSGNTAAAAEAANTALIDMSDNANKMGTDLSSLQWAYQGFAKQNYTMLDNLKLGYGGTKQEMQRLIEDANKLGAAQGKSNDLTIDSFADVVEAIHRVQENLGITGTTSREAATTIEGSIGSMKAAWDNWLAELGKSNADMTGLTSELATSIMTVGQNVIPRIQQIAQGALQGIGDAAKTLIPQLPAPFKAVEPILTQFANGLADGSISMQDIAKNAALAVGAFAGFATVGGNVDTILSAFDGIAGAASAGLGKVKGVASGALGIFDQFSTRWGNALGLVDANFGGIFGLMVNRVKSEIGGIGTLLVGLFDSQIYVPLQQGIAAPFQALAGKVGEFLSPVTSAFGTAFQGFGSTLTAPIQAGLNGIGGLFMNFFNPANFLKYFGIAAIIAALIAALGAANQSMGGQLQTMITGFLTTQLPAYLTQFQTWVATQLPAIMQSGVQLLTSVIQGITTSLPQLLATATTILTTLVDGIANALPTLLPAAMQMIITLAQGIVDNLPRIIQSGLNLLVQFVTGMLNAIPQLIAALPKIITSFVNGILSMIPQILTTGVTLLLKFVTGIVNAIPQLVAALPKIITGFITGIATHLPRILETGITLLGKLIAGILKAIPQLIAAIPQIIKAIWDGLTSVNWLSLGWNIVKGIAVGLVNASRIIVDTMIDLAKSAWTAVKKFFGIASPSRLMRDTVGIMVGRGLANGIRESTSTVVGEANRLSATAFDAFNADGQSFQREFSATYSARKIDSTTAYKTMPSNTEPTATGLSAAEVTAAVTAALQTMPDMNLKLNTGVVAGQLAPALDRELAARSYRGLA